MTSTLIKTDHGMAITGKLVFDSVIQSLKQGSEFIEQYLSSNKDATFEINCKQLSRIDSAGIAALIDWQRQCANANLKCSFIQLPEQTNSLIQAYRLKSLLAV